MSYWSPTKYNTLKRETLDFLKSEKSDYTEWLREEIRKKQEANAPFGKMTVEQAMDEIVSDAFESVLANEEFITKLYASDAGLTKQVNNWANKYYKQFSEGLKSAFVTDELTEAGKIMRAAGERGRRRYTSIGLMPLHTLRAMRCCLSRRQSLSVIWCARLKLKRKSLISLCNG